MGFGAAVLQLLIKSSIKKNLYYEIKERVQEERFVGAKTIYKKAKVKSYGTDNTRENRDKLMELLNQRVLYHKDKFIAPILHSELQTMEVKKSGKWEHAANAHDDQVFSYLMALYVWYYGENLMERFHIFKSELKTDQDIDESQFDEDNRYGGFETIEAHYIDDPESGIGTIIAEQQAAIEATKSVTLEQFKIQEAEKDEQCLQDIMLTPSGRRAVAEAYHLDVNYLEQQYSGNASIDIGNKIIQNFYESSDNQRKDQYEGNLSGYFRKIK